MPGERDSESGKYTQQYPKEDFIEALREYDGMASSGEIAEIIGCTTQLASLRMREFREEGRVTGRKVGRSTLWMLADE